MALASPRTTFLLTASMLKGVGPAALRKVAAVPGFEDLSIFQLAERLPQIARAVTEPSAWAKASEAAERQLEAVRAHDARLISALDPEYPQLLAATKDDPFLLYVKGRLAPEPDKSVAVIGTREPTAHGEMIAARISSFFVEQGWSIVSGLAIGCDAVAHRTALECKGHTVAVLAHGLHTVAPSRHARLAQEILESGGALISEYPFGQDVQKQQYVKRDKTQAGLARGVVMIQSDLVGGSLHASRAALDYGRWLAVPFPTERDRERGEPKVQANLMLAGGSDGQRKELLRCPVEALDNVVVLWSKDDYAQLLSPVVKSDRRSRSLHGEQVGADGPAPALEREAELAAFLAAEGDALAQSHLANEPSPTPTSLFAQLTARQKYIAGKLREIDAFVDCFPEASSETKWELQFELESVLAQMLVFVGEAETSLRGRGALRPQLRASATKLSQDLSALRNLLVHGIDAVPRGIEEHSSTHHVAGSARVRQLRTEFQDFAAPALELLRSEQ